MIHLFKLVCSPKIGAFDKNLPPLFDTFQRDVRGHDKKLVYDGFKHDIRKYQFNVKNVKIWNSLPQSIINSDSIHQFERNLDNYWSQHPLYYDDYKSEII